MLMRKNAGSRLALYQSFELPVLQELNFETLVSDDRARVAASSFSP
jgi:hypothetical protein